MAKKINFNSDTLLNLKFSKNVKGYDAYQVDSSLDKVLDDYRFYESFYTEAKSYIASLEGEIKKLKDQIKNQDIEIAKYKKRLEGIKDGTNVTSENIDLLKKISSYEKVLYSKGIDPNKIK